MNLLDLPDDNLLEIAGKLDLCGISNLRKVNHRFRELMDTRPPTMDFATIHIFLEENKTRIEYKTITEDQWITYSNVDGNCLVNQTTLIGQNYQDVFGRDFELNICYQKGVLDEFSIDYRRGDPVVFEKISNLLQSRIRKLQVEAFSFITDGQHQVLRILPFLDPFALKSIQIDSNHLQDQIHRLEEYEQLEQWMNAEKLESDIKFESSECFSQLLHFKIVYFNVDQLYLEDLLVLRDAFLTNPLIEHFCIEYSEFSDKETFMDLLGIQVDSEDEEDEDSDAMDSMIFRIPNSSNVLSIGINDNCCCFERFSTAEECKGKEVVENIGTVAFFKR